MTINLIRKSEQYERKDYYSKCTIELCNLFPFVQSDAERCACASVTETKNGGGRGSPEKKLTFATAQ